uniref:Prefoldin n=1 Tax=Chenopodium quinoa TaxID=63459 RepID=A0A803MZW6_CHEQI
MTAAASSSSSQTSPSSDPKFDLVEIKRHEVAIAELNSLPSSRHVYLKNGNIFFRTTIQKAITYEQKQLDLAKSKPQKLNRGFDPGL